MAANKKRKRAAPRKQTKHRGTTARASKKPAVGKETAKAPKRFSTLGPTGGPRPPYGSFSGKAPSGKRLTGTTGEAGFVGTANSRPSGGTAPVGLGSTPASSQEMPIYPSTIRSPGATGSSAASGRAELTLTPGAPADPRALHAEMLDRIDALERAMASSLKRRRRGIGHNNPPEPIEPEPLSANELREIRRAMAVLRAQPPAPSAPSTEARAAVTLLTKLGDRLRLLAIAARAYLGKQVDNFVTEAVKESAKRIVQSPFWLAVINQLPALADVAHQWLASLGPHI